MPVKVFLSHASVDKPTVRDVKAALEEGGDIECWLDEVEIGYGENIAAKIDEALDESDLVLFFLSPTSVQSKWVKEEWTAAYWDQVNSGQVKLIPVLIGDCQPPKVLRNKKYCDLRTNQLEALQELKTQLLKPTAIPAPMQAASLPNFVGREAELADLKNLLTQAGAQVRIVGMPGLGKTYLAREFVRRHGQFFEAVYEVQCQKKDLAALTGDVCALLGIRIEGDAQKIAAQLQVHLSKKRCLLVLDNVEDDQPRPLVPAGRASILVTARSRSIPFLAEYREVTPNAFSEAESLVLFRRILASVSVDEAAAQQLVRRFEHLPLAVSVAAGLIRTDVRYSVKSLLELKDLNHGDRNVARLLQEAIDALEPAVRQLLTAMAACAPSGFHVSLAAKVAGINESQALDVLQPLFAKSLIIEIDRDSHLYRLHPLVSEAVTPEQRVRRKYAACVYRSFQGWKNDPLGKACLIPQAAHVERTVPDTSALFSLKLAMRAGALCLSLGRMGEADDLFARGETIAVTASNRRWLQRAYGNRAAILQGWGRLSEAFELYKKQEEICLEIGDKDGLQRSYGNQALVLQFWGKLDEALALHKRQEEICVETDNREGLQRAFGNQAVILRERGFLDEAMALHKRQEQIALELQSLSALQLSYAGQALILKAWGRREEAMDLHKKEADICGKFGDQAGLQRSLGNQAALILKTVGRQTEAMKLLKQQEEICLLLNDQDSLQRSYGNQALILQDEDRLKEAMDLYRKKETICLRLNNQRSLAYTYWQSGSLAQKQKNLDEARQKFTNALAIFTQLKMPRERDMVQAALNAIL